jgi:aryl-alcohol dehydrogenase-like predicted oxidoreductase/predicted kinase
MRISTNEADTIAAAADAGITVFDTARAYEDNESLLAGALRACGAEGSARVVTKGGMKRAGGAWIPDGRAKAIRTDCEASLAALDGLAIDLYLIHAPDPRTPWRTSVRALARLADEGLVRRVGVSNVNRTQLDEALEIAPIAAVEVALSRYDDRAVRGGLVERCEEAGLTLIAHSPLGGPRRARSLDRREAELALASLLALSPAVVAIPGARRPETARSAARAASLVVDQAFPKARPSRVADRPRSDAEVVLVMGIPGAGKSRVAEEYAGRGYVRLNRDERGGSLPALADALDEQLAAGASRIVLDNTYLTRASRSYVLDAASRHGVATRCVWLETPLAQAQVNLVERLLDRFGTLPTPDQLQAVAREPGMLMPTSQMRTLRELEPPSADEGFADVERIPFERTSAHGRPGVFVAGAAVRQPGWQHPGDREAPHLIFDWSPGGTVDALADSVRRLSAEVSGPVEAAVCPHEAGPPRCWCRPPLPGLPLAFARAHGIDPARSILVGTASAHRTLANALGAQYVAV